MMYSKEYPTAPEDELREWLPSSRSLLGSQIAMSLQEQRYTRSGDGPEASLYMLPHTSSSHLSSINTTYEIPSSQLASLDFTATRHTYTTHGSWTELEDLAPYATGDETEYKLLTSHLRRSSAASSASFSSTLEKQTRLVRLVDLIGSWIHASHSLPGIRHVLWLCACLSRAATRSVAKTRFHGWRMGMILGCCMSSVVLLVNILVLVTLSKRGRGFEDGIAVSMTGTAEDISWWSSAFHIAINAMSTMLLSASNYTMQVLSSPTRNDIDKAHAKSEHLDIGVLSMRNLARIPKRRLFLFIIMALSSIPIHLFYNSAVFYIGANNQYDIQVVQVDSEAYHSVLRRSIDGSDFEEISDTGWVRAYDNSLVSFGTLVLVVDEYRSEIERITLTGYPEKWPNVTTTTATDWDTGNVTWNMTEPLLFSIRVQTLFDLDASSRRWINLRKEEQVTGPRGDLPRYAHVTRAFATRVNTASRIQLSLTFMIIVIVCNVTKLSTMLWIVSVERKDYIVTLGDGAASFLETPDPSTERLCVLSKPELVREIKSSASGERHNDQLSRLVTQSKQTWTKQSSTYSNALNRDREIGSYFIFIVIGILFVCLLTSLVYLGKASTAWGTASDTTFREASPSLHDTLLNAWLANAAQLILSCCYLAINSECTAMAGAAEWNSFASSRKGLRVTRPVGQQRDTYFLQLPYRWSLPLTIISGGLHWLLSQSIFLVRIETYDRKGKLVEGESSKSACGFAPTSFTALTICFFLLVGIVGLMGRKKIKVRIPFAASCSLVISAACHTTLIDAEAYLKPVQWGVVEESMYDGELHCSISSKSVTRPKAGTKFL